MLKFLWNWFIFLAQGRLKPGRMLLVDTKEHTFMKDEVLKDQIANLRPYGEWLKKEVMENKMLCYCLKCLLVIVLNKEQRDRINYLINTS